MEPTNRKRSKACVCLEEFGGIPKTLGLEEQGRFALGYYSQLAQYRADRAENEAESKVAELDTAADA